MFFNLYSNIARVRRILSIGEVFVTRFVAANLNFDHVDLIRLEIGRDISGITDSEIFAIITVCFIYHVYVITVSLDWKFNP